MNQQNPFGRLSKFERILWGVSVAAVALSFLAGNSGDYLTLIASLIGVTALIFVARGDVIGQVLTIIFSVFYGIISYHFSYYGEMLTYLGMTAPIAAISVITWLKNPYDKAKSEVKVAKMSRSGAAVMFILSAAVTFIFYFILRHFGNANLIPSTISVTTSFLASYLMMMRIPYYALAYAANDVVLIILWILATLSSLSYLPMVVCFLMFFINDLYGFFNWRKMMKRQAV
ncbi:MAG: nicotinamide mononucleotide transporter [Clostridia bacterium]|nr:nicotinamide mononucleotide transporter [Clostridia bacterium]